MTNSEKSDQSNSFTNSANPADEFFLHHRNYGLRLIPLSESKSIEGLTDPTNEAFLWIPSNDTSAGRYVNSTCYKDLLRIHDCGATVAMWLVRGLLTVGLLSLIAGIIYDLMNETLATVFVLFFIWWPGVFIFTFLPLILSGLRGLSYKLRLSSCPLVNVAHNAAVSRILVYERLERAELKKRGLIKAKNDLIMKSVGLGVLILCLILGFAKMAGPLSKIAEVLMDLFAHAR